MTTAAPARKGATYKGRPVPYVTKWTGENIEGLLSAGWVTPELIAYDEETPTDRDSHGVLWWRDGIAPGEGEPMWKLVHTGRHRRAMRVCLCQVCGQKITGPRIPWLLPAQEWERIAGWPDGEPRTTSNPPTCRSCWPVAMQLCPALRRDGWVTFTVGGYEPYGVLGNVYPPGGDLMEPEDDGVLSYSATRRLGRVIGKQAVVTLHEITPEPEQ